MTILLLTPVSVESQAIRRRLSNIKDKLVEGRSYGFAPFKGKYHDFELVLHQTGSKNEAIALATEKAVQFFQPNAVLLVGIAGGIKDVDLGDIVVATKAYGYESGKLGNQGFMARPEVLIHDSRMLALAETIARSNDWSKRLPANTPTPKVFFGPIASGNKVIASTESDWYQIIKKHYNDTLAVEMESIGFAWTLSRHPLIPHINIRSISDLIDDKTKSDLSGNQEIACLHATAFAFELLYQLKLEPMKPAVQKDHIGLQVNNSAEVEKQINIDKNFGDINI